MTVDAEAALDMSLDDVIVAANRTPKGKGKGKSKSKGKAIEKAIEKAGGGNATEPDASAALLDLSLEEVIAASSKGAGGRKGGKGQGYEVSGKANDKGKGRSWKGGKDRWEGGGSSPKGDWEDWKGGKADKWGPGKDGGSQAENWGSKKHDSWGSAKQADSWKDWKNDKNEKWGAGTLKQDGWEDWKPMKAAGGEGRGSGAWARDRDGGKVQSVCWQESPGTSERDSKPDTWGKGARDRDRDRDRERNDEWIGRPARGHAGGGSGTAGKWWGSDREETSRASGRDRYPDRYEAQNLRTEASHDRHSGRGGGAGRGPAGGDGWPSGGQKRARHEEDDNDRDRRSKLIKVTNIPLDLDWKDIKEAFEAETGKIERCDLRGGTALIKFSRVEDAYRAAETFDRGELNGKIISVTVEH